MDPKAHESPSVTEQHATRLDYDLRGCRSWSTDAREHSLAIASPSILGVTCRVRRRLFSGALAV
jgi:hypothetical protein